MKSTLTTSSLTIAGILAIVPFTASAQDIPASAFEPCTNIADNTQRLACFDETYARETAIAVEREEEEQRRAVEDFGLSAVQINEREAEQGESGPAVASVENHSTSAVATVEGDADSVNSTVVEVFSDAARRQVILLANGQMWRSTSNKSFRGRIRPGWTATIRKNWSGGYRLKFEGQRGFLGVSRVR